MIDRKKNGKMSVGKISLVKQAVLLTAMCLAVSGCASRGQDGSGQGEPESAAADSWREPESNGSAGRESGSDASARREPGRDDPAGRKPGNDGPAGEDGAGVQGEEARTVAPAPSSGGGAGDEPEVTADRVKTAPSIKPESDSGSPAGQGAGAGLIAGGQGALTPASDASTSASGTGSDEDKGYDFTICFAGDINLDENWGTTQFLDTQENGIYDCISEELVETMQAADIMCLNNEFTYSTGGSPLPGKVYTFRAKPERVEVLHQLGVDAVTLANNHVYDYGKEALLDTFEVLEEAEIPYFGAGRTLEDAMKPLYLEADGKRIALVGASRAEKNKMTPQATETEPGILRCYDTELYLQAIREGKENADFCIAFVHWGTEYSFELEQVQPDTGREYLDAGADAVIGAHSHCLQGMEYYDGKPIIYSLGNYWFNEKTLDTMLLQLHFTGSDGDGQLEVQVIPAVQAGYRTTWAAEVEEQRRIYDFLESISLNVEISDEGIVSRAG